MTNGEKLKELFNTYFPGVVLDEELLSESCNIFACPVDSMEAKELNSLEEKVSKEDYSPCKECSYDNWWKQEYKKWDAEYTKDYMERLKTMGLFELKEINQKTKELINAAYENKALQVKEKTDEELEQVIGTDQFIQKESEGGF